jgi:SPP1 gp7 family putative phage head morphogenesis protein
MVENIDSKKEISRLRSEVRALAQKIDTTKSTDVKKDINPYSGLVSGNYWTQTGMPWISSEGRKAVLTEWFWQPIRGQPRRVDTNELRQFSQTFWINSCVNTLIDEIASLDWDIVPKDEQQYEKYEGEIDRIKEFLQYPNKNRESFTEIIKALIKDVLEVDAGVLVKVFSIDSYDFDELEAKSGAPLLKPRGERTLLEIYCRDGTSFLKETDKFGFVNGYWQYSYQIPAHPMWFNRDEICYVSEHPRSMSTYGFSRTQAIMDIVKSLHYSTLFNKRFFEESAIPDGALGLEDTSAEEMKAFMDYWNNDFKAQPHKLAVINKKITWQPFTISNRELEFLETQKWYYTMVIGMFGLTPTELGITDNANRATSATQAEVTKRKGIRPMLRLLEKRICEEIIGELTQSPVEFTFIYDDPSEKAARLTNWTAELNAGLKTINEVRNEMGLTPVEWGDLPKGMQVLPDGSVGTPNPMNQEQDKKPDREGGKEPEKGDSDKNMKREEGKADEKKNVSKGLYAPTNEELEAIKNQYMLNADTEELKRGISEEMEHAGSVGYDLEIIVRIVVDHLKKNPHYYSQSGDVEKKGEGTKGFMTVNVNSQAMVPIGQYYIPSQPLPVSKPPHLPIQEVRARNENHQDKPAETRNQTACTTCGNTTLHTLANPDEVVYGPTQYICINCGTLFSTDNDVLTEFANTLMNNGPMNPPTTADWSPKSVKKSLDTDMTLKEYVGFDFSKAKDPADKYAGSREYNKLISEYLSDLSQNKIQEIIQTLKDCVSQGKNIRQTSNEINMIINDPVRAETIARTEVIRIVNEGNRQEMKNKGVTMVEWISAPEDGRLCPICKSHDGKKYSIDEIKRIHPSHPRCRCSFTEFYESLTNTEDSSEVYE